MRSSEEEATRLTDILARLRGIRSATCLPVSIFTYHKVTTRTALTCDFVVLTRETTTLFGFNMREPFNKSPTDQYSTHTPYKQTNGRGRTTGLLHQWTIMNYGLSGLIGPSP